MKFAYFAVIALFLAVYLVACGGGEHQNDTSMHTETGHDIELNKPEYASPSEREARAAEGVESREQSGSETRAASDRTDRVRSAQERLRGGSDAITEPLPVERRYRMRDQPFATFNDSDGYTNFNGVSTSRLREVLGEPPTLVRQFLAGPGITKEVWVYRPYQEDSTGLYLYIRDGKVETFRLDTFLGIANSDILDYIQSI